MSSFLTPASLTALIAASKPSSRGVCSRLRPYFVEPRPTIATLSISGFLEAISKILSFSSLSHGPEGRRRVALALDPGELDGHAELYVLALDVQKRGEVA